MSMDQRNRCRNFFPPWTFIDGSPRYFMDQPICRRSNRNMAIAIDCDHANRVMVRLRDERIRPECKSLGSWLVFRSWLIRATGYAGIRENVLEFRVFYLLPIFHCFFGKPFIKGRTNYMTDKPIMSRCLKISAFTNTFINFYRRK